MNLPWVARSTLTAVTAERDWLRGELAKALDHNRRIDRVASGLTEVAKEAKAPDPVPAKIRTLAGKFGSSATQQDQLSRATRAHAGGMSWDEVEATMLAALNEGQ